MPKVHFVQERREAEVEPGRTIREIALELGIDPNRKYQRLFSCEGHGIFDGCKCWVKDLGTATYVVQKGDLLSFVAERFGTTAEAIANANGRHHYAIKPGEVLKLPGVSPKTWAEHALHDLKGWQRLACQARVMGDVEVYTMVQGDERLREPRPITPPPPKPAKRERFLESRFRSPAPDDDAEGDDIKTANDPPPKPVMKPATFENKDPVVAAVNAPAVPVDVAKTEAAVGGVPTPDAKADAMADQQVELKREHPGEKQPVAETSTVADTDAEVKARAEETERKS